MKLFFLFAFLAVLATTVIAWEKEDHEIFDLVSEVEAAEGKGTTFYSWLDVSPTASTTEISKAYRKMSMQFHPDKNPGVKGIHQRFARLGVVATILRNKEGRKRYDFFYKNGVPKWRGTGYYYQRFRPGLGSVLVFLVVLTSGLQLLVERMNYKRDVERIDRFTREARAAAWGPKLIPNEGQRKVKVNVGGQSEDGGTNRWIEMVVEGQNVYLLDPAGDMHLLDMSSAVYPVFMNTWPFVVARWAFRKVTGRGTVTSDTAAQDPFDDDDDDSSVSGSDAPTSGRSTPKRENSNGNGKVAHVPTTMAGGKRRKATKKR
ncbi:DnaJ domain-containing protein [Collybia nuda]|uniref:DnaJ domain-containing protein n=1 Tax=Collybia nuda TaxID=64659 RepID=A0A9P6CFX7_9AGAR|nr:DnaJ domain-containing protein [Collybia nuda]